ncbi:putative nucleic acid-binding, replication factor A [Helianthus annuus]|uniref:Nucleic acid-binding, replication factor A n=1 Tax=Helianthus annuus TaxID=4232 RepID=A0A251T7D1_HELAN|nr:uncharacterized protein LOC110891730 isoform X2 [Helianthus annuus]KAF5780406.1 putative nucleic acid-binding, replication factor A [Helianthus annuus]KAJ0507591.1 putative nucleic acid-binding, replication factor A [Helianthus annuus]KAJ0873623.1 putative nucleic acid-binding, replication factor A [Helianthus annuus]
MRCKSTSQNISQKYMLYLSFNLVASMTTKATSMSQTLLISLSCSSMNAMKRLLILEEVTLRKKSAATPSVHRPVDQSRVTSNEAEFLQNNFFSTIGRIREITKDMHVIVVGTVTVVNKDNELYYLGCESCNRKASPSLIFPEDDDGSDDVDMKEVLICTNKDCKRDVIPAVCMYKLSPRVEDCTGTVNLTLFDCDTVKLLGLSAKQMVDKYLQSSGGEKVTLVEFDSFIDKKYAFKIRVGTYNVDKNVDGFSIYKLVDDPAIIATLEKKFDVPECG